MMSGTESRPSVLPIWAYQALKAASVFSSCNCTRRSRSGSSADEGASEASTFSSDSIGRWCSTRAKPSAGAPPTR
jgi:hypothetical protein